MLGVSLDAVNARVLRWVPGRPAPDTAHSAESDEFGFCLSGAIHQGQGLVEGDQPLPQFVQHLAADWGEVELGRVPGVPADLAPLVLDEGEAASFADAGAGPHQHAQPVAELVRLLPVFNPGLDQLAHTIGLPKIAMSAAGVRSSAELVMGRSLASVVTQSELELLRSGCSIARLTHALPGF